MKANRGSVGRTIGALLLVGASCGVLMTGWDKSLAAPLVSRALLDPGSRPQGSGTVSGEVSWALPGRVVVDARGTLYQSLEKGASLSILSRLDRATGKAIWSRNVSGFFADASCITAEVLIMKAGDEVLGIDTATGKTRWSTDLDGGMGEGAYLSCSQLGDEVFLHHGASPNKVSAISKLTGENPWTYLQGGYADLRGITRDRVVIVRTEGNVKTLTALDARTGQRRWAQAVPGSIWLTFDRRGDIVLVDRQEVCLLDGSDGRKRWTYRGSGGRVSPVLHEQALFIAEKDRLVRLEETSGKALWSYGYGVLADKFPSPTILRSGDVVIHASDYQQQRSTFVMLDQKTGIAIWTRDLEDTVELLTEDQAGTLYLVGGNRVSRLSRSTGAEVWTFARTPVDPGDRIFGLIGNDERSLYLSYGKSGWKHPPMGILALDRGVGVLRWEAVFPAPIYLVGSDEARLYLSAHNQRIHALLK